MSSAQNSGAHEESDWSGPLQTEPLQSAIQRAAAQSQCARGMTDVSSRASQGLTNQKFFDIFEAHFLNPGSAGRTTTQSQIAGLDATVLSHQNCPLDHMIE